MKKICFIIPSLHAGGMERVMSELINYFTAQNKYEIHLILIGIKREIFYEISRDIFIHKPDFEFDNKNRTWCTIKTMFFLRKIIREIKPNSILSFGELWNNLVLLSCLGLSYPIFVSDRCQPDKSLGRFHDFIRIWLYPKSAGIICQTITAERTFKSMFHHDNFVVIGNPIRQILSLEASKKENEILTVGRLIESKHHDELIKIFAEINPSDWKLIIVGGDALKQQNKVKLETLIEKLGMKDKIILTGNRSDVDDYYNKSKIFAFTSSSEGFPNVIGEAMSAGLPVVAYDCSAGPRDLIEHEKTGYLVDLHDSTTFRKYLLKLIADEKLRSRMGIQAKVRIQNFSVEVIAQQFEKVIIS